MLQIGSSRHNDFFRLYPKRLTKWMLGIVALIAAWTHLPAQAQITAPGAPQMVTLAATYGKLTVSFLPPISDGGSPINFYEVSCDGYLRSDVSSSPATVTVWSGDTISCTVSAHNSAGLGASSLPSAAITVPTPPNSYFYYRSQPGDFVGEGITNTIEFGTNHLVGVYLSPDGGYVGFTTPGTSLWNISFSAPPDQPVLAVREYAVATNHNPDDGPAIATLQVGGNGHGCNSASGTFRILEIVKDPSGQLVSFAANFENHCEHFVPALFGQIRYNSTIPVDAALGLVSAGAFTPIYGATPTVPVSSNSITVTTYAGVTSAPISIVGGEYSIGNAPYTAVDGIVQSGQTVAVRLIASPTGNSLTSATLSIADLRRTFSVATATGEAPQPTGDPLAVVVRFPFNSSAPIDRLVYSPATGAYFELGAQYDLGVGFSPLPSVAAGDGHGIVWSGKFSGPNRAKLVAGDYVITAPNSGISQSTMLLSGQMTCYNADNSGRMHVYEAEYLPSGAFSKLAIDYIPDCSPSGYWSNTYGYIRLNSTVPIDYTIAIPAPFNFIGVSGVAPGTVVLSNEVFIRGMTVAASVSVVGGEYSIDDGPFTSTPGTISSSQRLRLRVTAAAQNNALVTATVNVGDRSAAFLVGTAPLPRPQPSGDPLVVLLSQHIDTGATSEMVLSKATLATVSLRPSICATITCFLASRDDGSGSIGAVVTGSEHSSLQVGAYLNVSDTDYPPSPLALFLGNYVGSAYANGCGNASTRPQFTVHEIEIAPSGQTTRLALDFVQTCNIQNNSTQVSAIFGYVRINSNFPIDYTIRQPIRYSFSPVIGAMPGTFVESNEVTINGVSVPVQIAITGGEYSLDGGPFVNSAGIVSSGQKVKLRVLTSASQNTAVTTTVTIGESTAVFKVGTATGLNPQTNGEPLVVLISQGNDRYGQGQTRILSAATLATFELTKYGSGPRLVATYPAGGTTENWRFDFAAPNNMQTDVGTYLNAQRYGQQSTGQPGLAASNTGVYDCYAIVGQFTILEISYSVAGIDKLAVDFVQSCSGSDPLYGYIRINSQIPIVQVTDSWPSSFTFPLRSGVARGATVTSDPVVIQNINSPAPISITGGEYSVDGGPFVATSGFVAVGQSVVVRLVASSSYGGVRVTKLSVGGIDADFLVFTIGRNYLFTDVSGSGSIVSSPSGILCSTECAALFEQGTVVTLTANPGPGVRFTGWSGFFCNGMDPCVVTIRNSSVSITANFAATPPGTVTNVIALPGNGLATISFTPPADTGGPAILRYSALCNPGTISATSMSSPVVVSGLANGTTYTCMVTAVNVTGNGAPSTSVNVTPTNSAILALLKVQSRKTHGAAGIFNLGIDLSAQIDGNVTVESRARGMGHQIVFVFNSPVTSLGSATAVDETGASVMVAAPVSTSGNEVTVVLPDVANAHRITVSLVGVNAASNHVASLGFLLGDVNVSKSVDASDVSSIKARSGQTADENNYQFDVNSSGIITAADLLVVKAHKGYALP